MQHGEVSKTSRLVAYLLVVVLIASMIPTAAFAEATDELVDEPNEAEATLAPMEEEESPTPTDTSVPSEEVTPEPTEEEDPTFTPVVEETSESEETPEATFTPIVEEPTATPEVTATPVVEEATATPVVEETTATPAVEDTPEPEATSTPEPTAPEKTATPEPTATPVAEGICGSSLNWVLTSDDTLTISGTKGMTDYTSSFAVPWYSYRTKIITVEIHDGVTSIGDSAFYGCTGLTSITIPDSVTSIGNFAFYCCNNLTSITIPDDVISIGTYAFYSCGNLTSITIPEGVVSIGHWTFYRCTSLSSITISEGVTSIGSCAFLYCSNLTSITIPASVTSIGTYAFDSCTSLTRITIPDGVTSIENEVFRGCTSLISVTIGNKVTSIGKYAFDGCTNLTDVYYGGNLRGWKNINIDSYNSPLTSATIHYAVLTDSGTCSSSLIWAYDGSSTLTISGTGEMTNYSSSNSATTAPWKYYKSQITVVVIEEGVTSIGKYAFDGCTSLTSAAIPSSVTSIGNYTFDGCTSLIDVYYGGNLSSWNAIDIGIGNSYLTSATIHCAVPTETPAPTPTPKPTATPIAKGICGNNLTWSLSSNGTLAISGKGAMENYKYHTRVPWKDYREQITSVVIEYGVTSIGSRAFYDCTNLPCINLPDSIASIGDWAFKGCKSLSTIVIPNNVSTIGEATFSFCNNLSSIFIPRSVTNIDDGAFTQAHNLTDVYYGGSKSEWNKITIGDGNSSVSDATIHYSTSVGAITAQPIDATATAGDTVKFTVSATGKGLTYQWQYRTSESGKWKNSTASSATKKTLKVKGTVTRDGYQYRCIVTDKNGFELYTDMATLHVFGIAKQPSDVTVSVGSTAKFTVTATGEDLTYQWQYRTSESGKWKNSTASSATKKTVKVKGTVSKNGYQYRCQITDANGLVIYTDAATLYVTNTVITKQPSDVTVSTGSTAKFKVTATGDGLTYQWQYRTSSTGKWKNSTASSASKKTISVKGTASRNGYQYRCRITDANGLVIYTDAATLTVN